MARFTVRPTPLLMPPGPTIEEGEVNQEQLRLAVVRQQEFQQSLLGIFDRAKAGDTSQAEDDLNRIIEIQNEFELKSKGKWRREDLALPGEENEPYMDGAGGYAQRRVLNLGQAADRLLGQSRAVEDELTYGPLDNRERGESIFGRDVGANRLYMGLPDNESAAMQSLITHQQRRSEHVEASKVARSARGLRSGRSTILTGPGGIEENSLLGLGVKL